MDKHKWCFCLVCTLLGAVAVLCVCVATLLPATCSGGFQHAAVAADSLVCSRVGSVLQDGINVLCYVVRRLLQQGGSAVDGAIAALLCTAVVYPQSMGLGGGSVVTVRNRTGKVRVYNFRETVPRKFKSNLLDDCPDSFRSMSGSQWIGIPGELRGYEALHKLYGKLPWSKLFEEPIRLAREGIPVPPHLGKILAMPTVKSRVEQSSLCEVFCKNNKSTLGTGDMMKFPQLAESMQIIANKGADTFYSGQMAWDLIRDVKAAGGTLEMEDLRSYRVRVADAWTVPLGDTLMHIPPPTAGGALLAFILKIMQGFSLTPHSLDGDQKTQFYHHYIEAVKFANGQRRSIRDPLFNSNAIKAVIKGAGVSFQDVGHIEMGVITEVQWIPEESFQEWTNPRQRKLGNFKGDNFKRAADHLMDPAFIDHIRRMISPNGTHPPSYYSTVRPPPDHTGTSHVSVLDEDGLAVSATSTINHLFGGGVYSPRTGIILNNELADFCGRADSLKPGEQPPSSMTPAILESKSGGLLVIGGAGGSMITTAVALSVINHLWLGMSLKEAIDAPIVFVDSKNNVNFPPAFDQSVIDGLKALGHQVGQMQYFFNIVNAVEKEDGCIVAESDARKKGMADGY